MAKDFFKTSERQRTSAQRTRKRRVDVGKPQPSVIDEALSAAVRSSLKAVKRDGDQTVPVSAVLNGLFDVALDHLEEVRGLDRQQSRFALTARLLKRRRYVSAPAKKG